MSQGATQTPRHRPLDIFRYVRQHYAPPKENLSTPSVVAHRTAAAYATRPTDIEAHRTAVDRRHHDNLAKGHFSEQHRPYQAIGDVCLDSHTLFCQSMGVKLPPREHHVTIYKPLSDHSSADESNGDDRKGLVEAGRAGREKHWEAAGLAAIRTRLRETCGRRAAVRAGQAYLDHLTHCQKEAADGDQPPGSHEMVIQKLSSHHFLSSGSRKYTLAFDPETMILSVKPKGKCDTAARKTRLLDQRLETIAILMTSLANLKSRHLRRRSPLSADAVMTLRKPPSMQEGKHHSPNVRLGSAVTNHTILVEPASSNKSVNSASVHPRPDVSRSSIQFRQNRRVILSINQPRKETWEDIFVDGKSRQKRRPWHLSTDRSLGTWQQKQLDDHGHKSENSVSTFVKRQKQDFLSLQKSLLKQSEDKLNKHIRDLPTSYNLKVTSLCDLHPLWEIKGRDVAQLSTVSQDNGILPQKKEPWFLQLEKEVDELESPTPSMKTNLEQLSRFGFGFGPNITNVKEKLCLLTISLPVQEICQPVTRSSLTFVLTEIFSLPPDLLWQWLAYRNIHEVN